MKAKRRIESGSNSVTILDGSGGHVTSAVIHLRRIDSLNCSHARNGVDWLCRRCLRSL